MKRWAIPALVGGIIFGPSVPVPGDPMQSPGEGWEWHGQTDESGQPIIGKGAWYNPGTNESLSPDPNHALPIGPHTDYVDPQGKQWRVYPDGRVEPKEP